ncbi:MAG TPA: hybrid sensor histidine kinase/response regulator [Albitalea sp.]
MPSDEPLPGDERLLVAAPTRRDGEVTVRLLRKAGVDCVVCADLKAMSIQLAAGAGALLLTEVALTDPDMTMVLRVLERQPAWSDVPAVVLARERMESPATARALAMLSNVTVLDRPVSTRSMVSAVLSALRARRRQYQIREHMDQQARAEQALLEADQRKDEFLATLAHELRNPLAPIRTGLQVLAKVPHDADQSVRLREMMERQVVQLVRLIDELLDVSRISTGKVVLKRERVDMRDVIEAALEASQPAVDAAQHELRVELPGEPVCVVGDASRLSQVVGNLVHNAAKYTPSGGRITVALSERQGEAVVSVTDTGAGIPPDMLEHVFDMFTQVNRTLDRAQGGLGIGLSLVRRLMDLHGGRVGVESPGLERGSTFTICLPVAASELVAAAVPPAAANESAARRRLRVLVVDDNADAADSLAILLAAHGHLARTEYGAAAALEAAREFRPQAVFCDLGMPGMNGHEMAARLRADPRHASTVLVAVTGWGSEEDRRRTRHAGFDFHLTKPISYEAIDGVLSRI